MLEHENPIVLKSLEDIITEEIGNDDVKVASRYLDLLETEYYWEPNQEQYTTIGKACCKDNLIKERYERIYQNRINLSKIQPTRPIIARF